MNEKIIKKAAVPAIPEETFDRTPFIFTTVNPNGKTVSTFTVEGKKAEFRFLYGINAKNHFETELVYADNMRATVKATVYINGEVVANAYASRSRIPGSIPGERFIESAETAAIGRALLNIGIGEGFNSDEEFFSVNEELLDKLVKEEEHKEDMATEEKAEQSAPSEDGFKVEEFEEEENKELPQISDVEALEVPITSLESFRGEDFKGKKFKDLLENKSIMFVLDALAIIKTSKNSTKKEKAAAALLMTKIKVKK